LEKITFRCLECKAPASKILEDKDVDVVVCTICNARYPIVEGVIIAIKEEEDFYNYRRKLNRFLEFKNIIS